MRETEAGGGGGGGKGGGEGERDRDRDRDRDGLAPVCPPAPQEDAAQSATPGPATDQRDVCTTTAGEAE